jgi:hypothetical protein
MGGVPGALILVSILGMLAACNLQRCSEGAACAISNGAGPSAIPSPTMAPSATPSPSPSPTVKAESCTIEYMVLQPRDGLTLAKDQSGRLSLTPYQTVTNPDGTVAQREVSEACNLPRIPAIVWTSSSAAVTVGVGFEPLVTRSCVGTATITATLEGKVSNAVLVR